MQLKNSKSKKALLLVLFGGVALLWLTFDIVTKQHFDANYVPGNVIAEPIVGLFRFRLVHNTGAAWGIFSDATNILGFTSIFVCIGIIVFFLYALKHVSLGEAFGLALVLAGGIGNAIDRFTLGYVVDFIDFSFISFPVFNIADIGVTCGFVIAFISILIRWHKENKHEKSEENVSDNSIEKA